MKYCVKCGTELRDEAVVCTQCGCATGNYATNTANNVHLNAPAYQNADAPDIGLCVLAFLIPLFGFIYWGVKYKETPKKAQACGLTAIISFVLGIVLYVPMFYAIFA